LPSTSKTDKKTCPCGQPSGRDSDGKSIHPLSADDVWFEGLEIGTNLKLVQLYYRHFKNSHGFMGKLVDENGTVFFVTSATAMDFNIHHAGEKLYPDAN